MPGGPLRLDCGTHASELSKRLSQQNTHTIIRRIEVHS